MSLADAGQSVLSRMTARDGCELVYRLMPGRGTARFLLVHSLAMDHAFWAAVAAHLQDDGDVLMLDCRGHGASAKPPGPYTADVFADDVADLLDAVGWRSATVAGASMGGCVALAFAASHPGRLDALALIDTSSWYGPEAPAQWEERAQKALAGGLRALIDFQKTRWFSDGFRDANPATVDAAVDVFLANDVNAYAESCRMLGRFDKRQALPHINVPTTVIVGEEDYAAPVVMAEAMRQGIPGAELHVIEGMRHLTPLECPAIVAGMLRDVVARSR